MRKNAVYEFGIACVAVSMIPNPELREQLFDVLETNAPDALAREKNDD